MTILTILLRLTVLLGLIAGLAGAFSTRVPDSWKKYGFTAAVIATVALVVIRIVLRITMPERVPSFSG